MPHVVAKVNDPVRAEAYTTLGLSTLCRTTTLVDDLGRFAGLPPMPGAEGVRTASGHHAHGPADIGVAPTDLPGTAVAPHPPSGSAERVRHHRRRRQGRLLPDQGAAGRGPRTRAAGEGRSARPPDRRRVRQHRDGQGRLRGQAPRRGGSEPRLHRGRRDRRRRGQPGRLPDGQAPLRRAADHRSRQQPAQRAALPPPRGRRDHQPHADGPRRHRAGHPGPRAAPPGPAGRRRAGGPGGADRARLAGRRPAPLRHPRCPTAAPSSSSSATRWPRRSAPTASSRSGTRSSPSRARNAASNCTSS